MCPYYFVLGRTACRKGDPKNFVLGKIHQVSSKSEANSPHTFKKQNFIDRGGLLTAPGVGVAAKDEV